MFERIIGGAKKDLKEKTRDDHDLQHLVDDLSYDKSIISHVRAKERDSEEKFSHASQCIWKMDAEA